MTQPGAMGPGSTDSEATEPNVAVMSQPPTESLAMPKTVTCPVCATAFDPAATAGRCPVCGEQVVPAAALASDARLTPVREWLREGGWRLVLLGLFVAYEIFWFIWVWHDLAVHHVF